MQGRAAGRRGTSTAVQTRRTAYRPSVESDPRSTQLFERRGERGGRRRDLVIGEVLPLERPAVGERDDERVRAEQVRCAARPVGDGEHVAQLERARRRALPHPGPALVDDAPRRHRQLRQRPPLLAHVRPAAREQDLLAGVQQRQQLGDELLTRLVALRLLAVELGDRLGALHGPAPQRRLAYTARKSPSWRPRCRKPRSVRPVARWARSSGISSIRKPARAASTVIPISMPKRGANGTTVAKAGPLSARWPEIGACRSRPVSLRIALCAKPIAKPKPPPTRLAKTATARSQRPARTASASAGSCAALSARSPSTRTNTGGSGSSARLRTRR